MTVVPSVTELVASMLPPCSATRPFTSAQADARTLVRPPQRRFASIKPVEDMRQISFGDARAGIGDGQQRLFSLLSDDDGDRAVQGELERVRYQVKDDRFPHRGIDENRL